MSSELCMSCMLFQMSEFSLYEVASLYQWPRVIASLLHFHLNQFKYFYCVTHGLTNALHWNWQWIKLAEVKCFILSSERNISWLCQTKFKLTACFIKNQKLRTCCEYLRIRWRPPHPWTTRRQSPPVPLSSSGKVKTFRY